MVKHRSLDDTKIREAAIQIIQERGFPALTFQSLAKALDIRSQSLYNYYSNVESLIEAIGYHFLEELYDQEVESLTGISGREAISTFAEIAHQYFGAHGSLVQVIYQLQHYPDESPFVQTMQKIVALLERLAHHTHRKSMSAQELVTGLISSVMGFTVIEIMGFLPDSLDAQHSFDAMLTLYLNEIELS